MIQVYHSIFAELIQDFIAYKRAAGYKYETEAVYSGSVVKTKI